MAILGWPENGPYEAIYRHLWKRTIPTIWLTLAPGGRLVNSVGANGRFLKVIDRVGGNLKKRELGCVSFCPCGSSGNWIEIIFRAYGKSCNGPRHNMPTNC